MLLLQLLFLEEEVFVQLVLQIIIGLRKWSRIADRMGRPFQLLQRQVQPTGLVEDRLGESFIDR